MDHHYSKATFATAGSVVELWDQERSEPISTYTWGADTINTLRFNHTEVSVFASSGTDRTVTLYDVRYDSPLAKLVLRMKTNAICWNPMEAFNFTVANEDHQLYTFDMRKMTSALNVYKDHVSAVLDVDYSPTGEELVTGSYDQTIRIFRTKEGRSRDIYHTKRMQHVFCVRWSMDAKYIVSGSDDGNLRLWKARASEKIQDMDVRERAVVEYRQSLVQKFQHMPEIKRISRHRHVPRFIKSVKAKHRLMEESEVRRKENRKKHSKASDDVQFKAERKKAVVSIEQ